LTLPPSLSFMPAAALLAVATAPCRLAALSCSNAVQALWSGTHLHSHQLIMRQQPSATVPLQGRMRHWQQQQQQRQTRACCPQLLLLLLSSLCGLSCLWR
jgi:hypothetical protein